MSRFFQLERSDLLNDYRFEIKVPLDIGQFVLLRQYLLQNNLFPKQVFEDRLINSVYVDSFDHTDYTDNTSGIGARLKTRIRWYDDDLSKLTLERKIKANKASRKELIPLSNIGGIHPAGKAEFDILFQQNREKLSKIIASPMFPALQVKYMRKYYTLGPDLRMTIDTDQMFKGLRPYPQSKFSLSPVYSVAEFKFPAKDRIKMQKMIQNLPFRVFRHSKYVIGTEVTAY